VSVVSLGVLALGTTPAYAQRTYSSTVSYRYTASVTATGTASQKVSATASYGQPAVTRTATATATVTRRATASHINVAKARATATSAARARALATARAKAAAVKAARASATALARSRATAAARTALPATAQSVQTSLYAKALTAAKTAAPRTDACGTITYKANGTAWKCTFDDEFNGTTLDSSKWTSWGGVNYWGEPSVCYYDDADHVSVGGGSLNLSVTRMAPGSTCWEPSGTTNPTYGAGVVYTKDKFSQTYGRFEARIKFAGGTGIHDDFWLYPQNDSYPGQAEIDIAEPFGAYPDNMNGFTHVTGPTGTDDGGWGYCTIKDWASGYHTYQVDWTPTSISFIYDGQTCYTYANWTPMTGYSAPAPFNQNFFMILQALADDGTAAVAPTATTVLPATMQVDWVRVWS